MATLALSLAGQALGGMVAGPLGATVGRALGALGGSALDTRLFGETAAPVVRDVRLQGASEGLGIPRIYGWNRLSGNIIWATELEELLGDDAGAKGLGGAPSGNEIAASFAVAFCEGEVAHVGRLWADGQPLETEGLTIRLYKGSETQNVDSLIEARQGPEAPAYRGVCYLVFERLPLGRFGNRIPTISAELCRVVGDLEPQIAAITGIPGATEFGYDPQPRVRIVGPGETRGENTHLSQFTSDWTLSIDELQALCPNLKHVALVVSWFGDDLRCGHCTVGPRVEAAQRNLDGVKWSVAGLGRSDVPVVSQHAGGPAYGGTPSDEAVHAAIVDLKARGLEVMLYPLIMMDVPAENDLPNPYGGSSQPAYPWRGRVTAMPAPGEAGSPNGTADIEGQVAAFIANGYRQMHLHYAQLAADAGGIDAILIGSEMRGMTALRSTGNRFVFVDDLISLAAEVRAIVGSGTKITYAADWSEYSGVQEGSEKFFHLDPLWASADIDAIGIDNYMPVADWREDGAHADAQQYASGHDLAYLAANIMGGEGFDWFYASEADRKAGVRTPITDGLHDEPWIWRFKDIRSWWEKPHYDRPGGVRALQPTAWVPGSKPIWFTELGCGAVDKGANQPNLFGDEKSAEDGRPYFSTGTPDALIQRQFLRAHVTFWRDESQNPPGMVDTERLYLWTWDARAYPAFPARDDIWADSVNYPTGHWLTGRLGGMASDELAAAVLVDHMVENIRCSARPPWIAGYHLPAPGTAREALEPIIAISDLSVGISRGEIWLKGPNRAERVTLDPERLADTGQPLALRRRSDPGERFNRLTLTHLDRISDYQAATASAVNATQGALAQYAFDLVLDASGARMAAEQMLSGVAEATDQLEISLPTSRLDLEIGDLISLDAEGPAYRIEEIEDGAVRRIKAQAMRAPGKVTSSTGRIGRARWTEHVRAIPLISMAVLPPTPDLPTTARAATVAYAKPWPGPISLTHRDGGEELLALSHAGRLGEVLTPLGVESPWIWSGQSLKIRLFAGHLSDEGDTGALAGTRKIAVSTEAGWEVIGFGSCNLEAAGVYRLSRLIRGMDGSEHAIGAIEAGASILVLDDGAQINGVPESWLGQSVPLRLFAGPDDIEGRPEEFEARLATVLPLAPVHLRVRRLEDGGALLTWVRRSRADSGNWEFEPALDHAPEHYRVTLRTGGEVVREWRVSEPSALYPSAWQVEDSGATAANLSVEVCQLSAVYGPGHAVQMEISR
ncbi:hypothetical protein GCM10007989_26060 [Devosia pacifica]|uniref:Tail protein n=1 Tax=Devosia pacifica TaxID=1335967 RepID=A0A918VU29_9HYPH|nr:glycoside hydrolase/phage tail family protein [Devosia pacifica]GHA29272.1 hypothetical protein GCM10007989_26060 [Devosia pacifica]